MGNINYSRQLNDKRSVDSLEFVSCQNSTFCNIWPLPRAALVSAVVTVSRASVISGFIAVI